VHRLYFCLLLRPKRSFSGITPAALEPITTTLSEVQAYLRTIITPSTILLGHSLESDLRALQLAHPHCIDTALIFHHPRGRPLKPGLAWLTRRWLNRTIQDRGPGGHDPEEDARACIDLLKAKIKNGAALPRCPSEKDNNLIRWWYRARVWRVQDGSRANPCPHCTFTLAPSRTERRRCPHGDR
jgi:DNA polymerase III epsilon subunit-like protein